MIQCVKSGLKLNKTRVTYLWASQEVLLAFWTSTISMSYFEIPSWSGFTEITDSKQICNSFKRWMDGWMLFYDTAALFWPFHDLENYSKRSCLCDSPDADLIDDIRPSDDSLMKHPRKTGNTSIRTITCKWSAAYYPNNWTVETPLRNRSRLYNVFDDVCPHLGNK